MVGNVLWRIASNQMLLTSGPHCLTKECYRNAPCLRPDATECWSHKVSWRIQPLKPKGAGQRSQEDPPQSIGRPDLRVLHAGDPPY